MRIKKKRNNDIIEILKEFDFNEIQKSVNLDIFKYLNRTKDFLKIMPKNLPNNTKALDIGIGSGWFSVLLHKLYICKVKGIGLEEDKSKFINYYKKYNIDFISYDITKGDFPFNDKEFDIVIFMEVLEHLICPHPPYIVFDEIHRILKDDGILIFSTPNFPSIRNRISVLRGNNPTYWYKQHYRDFMQHIREYTLKELEYILKICKFVIIEYMFRIQRPAIKSTKKLLLDAPYQLLEKIFPKFRTTIIIKAKKIAYLS